MAAKSTQTYFKTIQKFKTDYSPSNITQYVSERTGMNVVVVEQKGPKVLGFFALATEIYDDSGAPHTLEHLCFMGSKRYRYKGFLDKLATRAYSNTNAWTATDHTAYTLETAGWEGFAQILPVYLEHIILPTLTDAGCYTEVHHIDGTGHDAGVVYSEMQGVQNTQGELMDLASKRLLYAEDIGFRYETGGMMEQLRVLTADHIREFHSKLYQPKNLCLILVGEVDQNNMLSILDDFEETILQDIPAPDAPFQRPWVESKQAPALSKSWQEVVKFPEEDESTGDILISFFGPSCNDVLHVTALGILLTYLAGSSASVLENILVEKEHLASAVYYSTENRPRTLIQFTLSSVAADAQSNIASRFFEILRETAGRELDMKYINDCISREKRQVKFRTEKSGNAFTDPIIGDFLFGHIDGSTLKRLESLTEYDDLKKWTDLQWRGVLREWMSDAHSVTIFGKPSALLSKKLEIEEKDRVAAQIKSLGEEGLKEKERRLAEAKTENDKEIPKELLEHFKVPETKSIHFIDTITARSGAARRMGSLENPIQKIVDHDKTELPLFIHFEHVPTNFAYINLILGTESVPISLRPLLCIYLESFFTSPVARDGKRIEFEQVIMDLERDTVGYGISSAGGLGNPEALRIHLQVEAEKYETAIAWVKSLLFDAIFDVTRIRATTTRLLADIPEEKRSGRSMARAAALAVNNLPSSIARARDTLTQALYLKRVSRLLETAPDVILSQLASIRNALAQTSNFRVLVVANLHIIAKPVTSWEILTANLPHTDPLQPLPTSLARLSAKGLSPGSSAYIIPLPTIDSSFAVTVARGPSSLLDPSVPALMVATAYLEAVEGPLWTAVRGTGLAYGTFFSHDVESGQISFFVYRSPNAVGAFSASKTVIEDFLNGNTDFGVLALEGAISSIVLGIANGQATMDRAAQGSFTRQVIHGLPGDWNDQILKLVRNVSVDEIKAVMKEVILPVFESATANLVITCAPIMEKELVTGFKTKGFSPEVKPLAFFQEEYRLESDGQDEADDNDDEDEDEDDDEEGEEGGEDEDDNDEHHGNEKGEKGRMEHTVK